MNLRLMLGTPEYLSPSTVRNKKCGVEVDLWALGIVLHQMLLGYTPYGAPSPYLTFLRIKRSFLQVKSRVMTYCDSNHVYSLRRFLLAFVDS